MVVEEGYGDLFFLGFGRVVGQRDDPGLFSDIGLCRALEIVILIANGVISPRQDNFAPNLLPLHCPQLNLSLNQTLYVHHHLIGDQRLVRLDDQLPLALARHLGSHLEPEARVFVGDDEAFLVLYVLEGETDHIAPCVLEKWKFDAVGLFLPHFLLKLKHLCLRLITDSHQLILDVLASRNVLHFQQSVVGALQLGLEGERHQHLFLCAYWDFPLAVNAEGGLGLFVRTYE